jgi:L-arabinokinase
VTLRELRPDTSDFVARLEELSGPGFFERDRPLAVSRAPGRLDVMGGFADYSGSLALEMPIADAAFVAAQESSEPRVRVLSAPSGPGEPAPRLV